MTSLPTKQANLALDPQALTNDPTGSVNGGVSRRIKEAALALGFQRVGILDVASLQPFEPETTDFEKSLNAGYFGEMEWLGAQAKLRSNPASPDLMPGTQSIVCVMMNYYHEDTENVHDDAVKISKYARGSDYHDVLKKRLRQLLKTIQTWFPDQDVKGRALTDSAPISEKPLAVRAGLGWRGKNSLLLHPEWGSFFFLGELLLNIRLTPDTEQHPNYCGSCTRCIDACPTQAIVEPGVIDARKCIAYWTIEHKGPDFPQAISENLNGWLFGCDICQDVCPWNIRFAQETTEAEFLPRPCNETPRISDILALDEASFRERYRKSPLKRSKRTGLQRNARALETTLNQPPQ